MVYQNFGGRTGQYWNRNNSIIQTAITAAVYAGISYGIRYLYNRGNQRYRRNRYGSSSRRSRFYYR